MAADELPKMPVQRVIHDERERERRRIRDRQRRQSMSHEEKEKHLARRRRNYQLRRQRIEQAQAGSQRENTSIVARTEANTRIENQAVLQWGFDFNKSQGNRSALDMRCEGMEPIAHSSAKGPKRLSLNQVKHLARLLNTPAVEPIGGRQQDGAEVISSQSVFETCRSRKNLRLIHVKRLARALDSNMKQTASRGHPSETHGW